MKITVHTLNAFTKDGAGGNPAGVVLAADSLSADQMQLIAKQVGFSETASFLSSDCADYRLRYFTPAGEADLCGHATVAAFYFLLGEKEIKPGSFKLETKAGILEVRVLADGSVFLEQNLPLFGDIIAKYEIADSLGISINELDADLPAQIVSTGLADLIIPVKRLLSIQKMQPDMQKISQISRKIKAGSFHVFSLETLSGNSAHCRDFAPLYDIPEEAATGTASGALACYLHKYCLTKDSNRLIFEQGYEMQRASEIIAELTVSENCLTKISVGGKAANTGILKLEL